MIEPDSITLAEEQMAPPLPPIFQAGVLGKSPDRYPAPDAAEAILRQSEREAVARLTAVPVENVVQVRQVHGAQVAAIDASCIKTGAPLFTAEADALYTEDPAAVLCIRTADCLPIFVWRAGNRPLIGLIHAGWRGLAAGVIQEFAKTIDQVAPDAARMEAWIGPGISAAAYEVGADTAAHFSHVEKRGDRLFVDLAAEALERLRACGIAASATSACTFFDNEQHYSHRRGDAGRNLNYIRFVTSPAH